MNLLYSLRQKFKQYYLPIELIYLFLTIFIALSPIPEEKYQLTFFRNMITVGLFSFLIYYTQNFPLFIEAVNAPIRKLQSAFSYILTSIVFNSLFFWVIGLLFNYFIIQESLRNLIEGYIQFVFLNFFVLCIYFISLANYGLNNYRTPFYMISLLPGFMLPLIVGFMFDLADFSVFQYFAPHLNFLLFIPATLFQVLAQLMQYGLVVFFAYRAVKKISETGIS